MKRNLIGCFVCTILLVSVSHGVKPEAIEKWESTSNTKKLIKAINDKDPAIRLASIEALGRLKAESAVTPLGSVFSDDRPETTDAAIEALTHIGTEDAKKKLLSALNLQSDSARILAAEALGNWKYEPALDPLIKTVKSKPDTVATAAAVALGKLADPKAIPALAGQLQYGSSQLQLACAVALNAIGGDEAVKALIPLFNHLNKKVRQTAIDAFVTMGEPALPYAYDAIKQNDPLVKVCGLEIIKALGIPPSEGAETVYYTLAETTAKKQKGVDREMAHRLANLPGDTLPALIDALRSTDAVIRSTAFRTIEIKGKLCTPALLEAAETDMNRKAKKWFQGRNSWKGSPSWMIDLWAAAASLNPHFVHDTKWNALLKNRDDRARTAMSSPNFKPGREFVPLLINQLSTAPGTTTTINFFGISKQIEDPAAPKELQNIKLALDRLDDIGQKASFPLIAALTDKDSQVAAGCAEVLGRIYDDRAIIPLYDVLEHKISTGDTLNILPFYTSLLKLGYKKTDGAMQKIRPVKKYARLVFEQAYPDVEVESARSTDRPGTPLTAPAGFEISYTENDQKKKFSITFQRTKYGDWIPRPPLPATLP